MISENIREQLDTLHYQHGNRTFLSNLIVYTENPQREAHFKSVIDKVIKKFPSRVFLIIMDLESCHKNFDVTVEVKTISQTKALCDVTTIKASAHYLSRISYLLLPFLIPDMPVNIFWSQDILKQCCLFTTLKKVANRIIFDSESCSNISQYSKALLSHLEKAPYELCEINWIRLGSWRYAFTSVFCSEERINDLKKSKDVAIKYNDSSGENICNAKIMALYLQAWLASQLGWEYHSLSVKDSHTVFHYLRNDKRPVMIHLITTQDSALPSGTVTTCSITSDDDVLYEIHRTPHHLNVNISSLQQCKLPYNMPITHTNWEQTFLVDMLYSKTSSHYRNMLKVLSQIGESTHE
ncbi:MAG: glucose-6-phosphate dehydrogenase assembly protein OpcA [Chlamydiota bacterium]